LFYNQQLWFVFFKERCEPERKVQVDGRIFMCALHFAGINQSCKQTHVTLEEEEEEDDVKQTTTTTTQTRMKKKTRGKVLPLQMVHGPHLQVSLSMVLEINRPKRRPGKY
jgi:hypothetical protein